MGIAAQCNGYCFIAQLFKYIFPREQTAAAAFVDATGINFNNKILFGNKRKGFINQTGVPSGVFVEQTALVMHFYFVEMAYNVKGFLLNHLIDLMPVCSYSGFNIASENII